MSSHFREVGPSDWQDQTLVRGCMVGKVAALDIVGVVR